MIWAQLLAYVTGTVDQELLLRNEYLAAENRILKAQIKGYKDAWSLAQAKGLPSLIYHEPVLEVRFANDRWWKGRGP
jgi:hypothetical protein